MSSEVVDSLCLFRLASSSLPQDLLLLDQSETLLKPLANFDMNLEYEVVRMYNQAKETTASVNSPANDIRNASSQLPSKLNLKAPSPPSKVQDTMASLNFSRSKEEQLIECMMERVQLEAEQCKYYLEMAEWDLDNAIELYYLN